MSDLLTQAHLLKGITDPFSLLCLMCTVLGWVAYSGLRKVRLPSTSGIPIPLISLALVGISFIAFVFNVARVGILQGANNLLDSRQGLNLRVSFIGEVKHKEAVNVPFNITSPYIAVDCNSVSETEVRWNIPPGARDVHFKPSWQSVNAEAAEQASIDGTTVVARGTLRGAQRDWIGGCRGGGHGQLSILGSYTVDQTSSVEPISRVAFQGTVVAGEPVVVKIPTADQLTALTCTVSADSVKPDQSTAIFALGGNEAGWKTIAEVSQEGPKHISARLTDNALSIQIEK